jgi:uncharacterized RDD family membrane protein YckC
MSLQDPTGAVRPEQQLGTERTVIARRGAALAVDAAVLGVLVAAAGFFLGRGPALVDAVVVGGVYTVGLQGAFGQTTGKRLFGLVVVDRRGHPCSYRAAAVRTAVGVVDALPGPFLVGLGSALLTRRGQRLGDLAADTVSSAPGVAAHGSTETG